MSSQISVMAVVGRRTGCHFAICDLHRAANISSLDIPATTIPLNMSARPFEGFLPPQYLPHTSPNPHSFPQLQTQSPLPDQSAPVFRSQATAPAALNSSESFNVMSDHAPFPLYCPTPNLTPVYPSSRSTSCYSDGSICFTPQDVPNFFPEYSNFGPKRRHTYLEDDSRSADTFVKPNTTSAFYGGEGSYMVPDTRIFSEPLEMSRHRHNIVPDSADRSTSFEEAKTVPMGGMLRLAEEDEFEASPKRPKLATSPSSPDCVGRDPCERCAKSRRPCVFSPVHLTRPSSRPSATRRPSGLSTSAPISTSPIRRHSLESPTTSLSAGPSSRPPGGESPWLPISPQVPNSTGLELQLHPAMTSASPSSSYPLTPNYSYYPGGPPGTEFPQGLARSGLGLGMSLGGPRGYGSYDGGVRDDASWTGSGTTDSSSARPHSSGDMGGAGQALWSY
ncbi:hypothetical protein I350_02925 [Cryptococcus amylolentus CBS 6273]|uniref:Uncharacterized protein n=1 Tax=Cryptococcus amylolentus CBS 6273 TaxID=1296118 RepID=A0A1E3K8K1_9TREE|nr:hypothetical protein I350_02925 [Cryptococcus amylolentus CBS 6273]